MCRKMFGLTCWIALLPCCVPAAFSQSTQDSTEPLLLVDASVIDVVGGEVNRDGFVLIKGDRILEVGSMKSLERPPEAETIALQGMYVVPGLMDLHSHLLLHPYNEASWNDQVLKESLESRVIRATVQRGGPSRRGSPRYEIWEPKAPDLPMSLCEMRSRPARFQDRAFSPRPER